MVQLFDLRKLALDLTPWLNIMLHMKLGNNKLF